VILRPMLSTPADSLPAGPEWTYEVKWDGYRAIAVKDGASVRLISRNAKDLTADYPTIVRSLVVLMDGRWMHWSSATTPSDSCILPPRVRAGLTPHLRVELRRLLETDVMTVAQHRSDSRRLQKNCT
jgi:ATP dependent DNA ligase-like protein